MAAKFTVIFKDGREPIKNLSFQKALDYRLENLDKSNEYDIVESIPQGKPEKTKDRITRSEFIRGLSALQQQQIIDGEREPMYAESLKEWILVVKHKEQPFISPIALQRQREIVIDTEIKQMLTEPILAREIKCFFDRVVSVDNPLHDLSVGDVLDSLKRILKS
jgi:hypothetical protein